VGVQIIEIGKQKFMIDQKLVDEIEVEANRRYSKYSGFGKGGIFYIGEIKAFEAGAIWALQQLSDKPTVAITEAAHSANTMLGEVATNESDTHIGGVGAGSSETEIVKQNEQTKEVCRICGSPRNLLGSDLCFMCWTNY
jgi:hypothetical protein